ncbi:MAG TPA: hypothetical protein VJH23_02320 [archaeon]|nr:hypothetical protein [archaeon]
MLNSARRLLKRLAERVLDIDDTAQPTAHIKFFEDYLGKYHFDTNTADVKEFLGTLKRKHLVDEIVISSLNGSAIASTNGNAVSQAVTGAALFNYVRSEIPRSETIMVRANGTGNWHMIFQLNKKLFIVKASSDLSTLELRALAREIDSFLLHHQAT